MLWLRIIPNKSTLNLKKVEIVKRGRWLYDRTVEKHVVIIKQNWDYYFDKGYDDSPQDLNSKGSAYYAILDCVDLNTSIRSRTCLSLSEAINLSEEKLPSKVVWDD